MTETYGTVINCFADSSLDHSSSEGMIRIVLVDKHCYPSWLEKQSTENRKWLQSVGYQPKSGAMQWLPDENGGVKSVVFSLGNTGDFWAVGVLPLRLPPGIYRFVSPFPNADTLFWERIALAWALGSYNFTAFKQANRLGKAKLCLPEFSDKTDLHALISSVYLIRDLINWPASHLTTEVLSEHIKRIAGKFSGLTLKEVVGDALLTDNYPLIHAVGRASSHAPRLVHFTWGDPTHPRVSLVGKGVCFDTGGLQLKSSAGMLQMKKDMGGAAHVIGLAQWIMAAKLPIHLQVLIPVVENAVSGNALRPGDVVVSRKGISVEITNTDAEGRLILADALTEACDDKPKLLIDFATLTGAARVALGPDLPAFFCNNEKIARALSLSCEQQADSLWEMPLYQPYRKFLRSEIADIANASSNRYGGAITAALFLQEFIDPSVDWIHIDLMAFHIRNLPGRPKGGAAMGLRAVFHYLKQRFALGGG